MDSIDYSFDFIFTTLMPVRIAYPFDPDELETRNPPFIQDLIDLKLHDYHETVSEICKMIADLKQNGKDYCFLKQLRNYAILELKSHSRGGQKGGASCRQDSTGSNCFKVFYRVTNTQKLLQIDWKII